MSLLYQKFSKIKFKGKKMANPWNDILLGPVQVGGATSENVSSIKPT
jgi:hypothetical protein